MPQPEEDNVTQNTPTKINSTTTGTCVTHMGLMSRTGTRQSAMCKYRKMDHQEGFTCKNAQGYIDAGYAPCMKGMHKNVLPTNF
jgi:hypothetical protein